MSAQLFFSNSPSVLLDRLSANLDWSDPFRSPRIATPTPAMKRWVQLRLAEKRGIVANVEFLQLERMLWKRLESLDLEHVVEGRKPARLLDEQGLQLLILAYLRNDPPPEAGDYLGAGAASDALYAPRLCQLSRKLAGYFREYEYSRVQEHGHRGLAELWMRDADCFRAYLGPGTPASERERLMAAESWQKRIYHALFRLGGLRDRIGEASGQYRYTLPQYAEMVLAQQRKPADPGRIAPAFHLFGLSQISPFHRSLIQRLADPESLNGRHARFHIYSLNPCAEYWEDVLTPGERQRQQGNLFRQKKYLGWRDLSDEEKLKLRLPDESIQAEELHLEGNENPLLSRWGKPGRENIQLWCQVTQYDFSEYFRAADTRTLLGTLQDSVLHRRGRLPDGERMAQDDSLRILACPEIHREAETVLQDIIDALLRDTSLRPDDIAVLVPNMDKYRHVLAAVFGRSAPEDSGHVPFNLSDASASSESDYARAVRQLFTLAMGRFSRKDMFALAANPCFKAGRAADPAGLQAWAAWTERLNIFHAYDAEDKRARGYAPDTLHTWVHGLERLVLGTVMEAPDEDDARHFGSVVPFADGHSPDRELLTGFLAMVRNLHRDLGPFREAGERPWNEWLERCETVFEKYLDAPEDQPLEGYVRSELRRVLTELRAMDGIEALAGKTAAGVTFKVPLDLILARLDGLKAGREPHLSGGVNVSGLGALRSLPFKIIYVMGLGEGEFPDEDSASTLDLRRSRRVIGDIDPAGRNRYLFLETLLCASGRLRLSYVCKDVQQGKTFHMCSVLNELADYLQDCVLPESSGAPTPFRITQAPLLSRDPSLFATGPRKPWEPAPNPFREEHILAWLERRSAAEPGFPERLRESGSLAPGEIFPLPPPPPRPEASPLSALPLDDIRMFLENPARYALKRRLGIRDETEEDSKDEEDEPFFCPAPTERELIRKIAHRRLAAPEGSRQVAREWFERAYANLALRGQMPAGPYRELDREQVWSRAETVLQGIDDLFATLDAEGKTRERLPGIMLGDGHAFGMLSRMRDIQPVRLPPVRLEAADRILELHGELPCLFRNPEDGRCGTVVIASGDFRPQSLLPAFCFYAAALLSDSQVGEWLRGGPFCIHYVFTKQEKVTSGNWAPFTLSRDQAEAWLREVTTAMLAGTGFDMLPFDIIARILAPANRLEDGVDYVQAIREELDFADEVPFWNATPVTGSQELLDPQVPADAEAKIRSRLEVFFNFKPDSDNAC